MFPIRAVSHTKATLLPALLALLVPLAARAQQCGDGACDLGESACNCQPDCGAASGDACCTFTGAPGGEDCMAEPFDCACPDAMDACTETPPMSGVFVCTPSCGDGICDTVNGESFCGCPAILTDCDGVNGDGCCDPTEDPGSAPLDCLDVCGDALCTGAEDNCSCPLDCAPVCEDFCCSPGEGPCTCSECLLDVCGDDCCGGAEDFTSCPQDCPQCENDGICDPGGPGLAAENPCTCPADCFVDAPGDGCCGITEDACTPEPACPSTCGDGCCTAGETPCNCGDCFADLCGDGCCSGIETAGSCNGDCASLCGDGFCTAGEDSTSCAVDCFCTDGVCGTDEDCSLCAADCSCAAATEYCNSSHDPATCDPLCGNGLCAGAEDCATCPTDCGACAEPAPDAALPDATVPDAAIPDAAVPDAAVPDAAIPDAALPDAVAPDASPPDVVPEPSGEDGIGSVPDEGSAEAHDDLGPDPDGPAGEEGGVHVGGKAGCDCAVGGQAPTPWWPLGLLALWLRPGWGASSRARRRE